MNGSLADYENCHPSLPLPPPPPLPLSCTTHQQQQQQQLSASSQQLPSQSHSFPAPGTSPSASSSPSTKRHSPSPLPTLQSLSSCSDSSPSPMNSTLFPETRLELPQLDQIQQLMDNYYSSESSSGESEENLETVLSQVLLDPLGECMESIEDLATGILRTGKLSLPGEAGDMSKVQPMLLGLQATEREIAKMLPQLMQVPFFEYSDMEDRMSAWTYFGNQGLSPEDFLSSGHIRLGLPIDVAIYHLLNCHCAKGAKQAEGIIQTAQTIEYVQNCPGKHLMPALICSASVLSSPSPPLPKFLPARKRLSSDSGVSNDSSKNYLCLPGSQNNRRRSFQSTRDASNSSLLSSESRMDYQGSLKSASSTSLSLPFSPHNSTSALGLVGEIIPEDDLCTCEGLQTHTTFASTTTQVRQRKASLQFRSSQSSVDSFDDNSSLSGRRVFDQDQWNTSVLDGNMIVAMYGETTYPLLIWNPRLKLDFEMNSLGGLVTSQVVAVDANQPELRIRLHNPNDHRIAFSIRAFRQTTVHNSHVVYPVQGLHVLEGSQCWEEKVDIHRDSPNKKEYIVIELFVAALEAKKPSWNVMRKYAVMKCKKNRSGGSRRPSLKASLAQMPGALERKHDNLRLVIAHGLQCVVKKKHSAAEVIFTQALFLPDFQRIELKAFAYICLAVVAYRRKNADEIDSLTHALQLVNSVDKLVDICEAHGSMRMPRTISLVKQLRKELNIPDIVKSLRKGAHRKHHKLVSHYNSENMSLHIGEEGGRFIHHSTVLVVPEGALECPTEITISSLDHSQLQTMVSSTGWEKMVDVMCAIHVECTPFTSRFQEPVQISMLLPESCQCQSVPGLSSSSSSSSEPLLLLHSDYLRNWEDIRANSLPDSDGRVAFETDRTGWFALASVRVSPVNIASMALQSLSILPITLRVCAFGQFFGDNSLQITVLLSLHKDEDPNPSEDENTIDHTAISFPSLIQAYPGEKIRCQLRGSFQPDIESGEQDLNFNFTATKAHSCLCGKFVRVTVPFTKCHGGKLMVLRHVRSWDPIAEVSIHLSSLHETVANHAKTPP